MLPIEKMAEPQGLINYKNQMIAQGEVPTYDGFRATGKERDEDGNRIPLEATPFYELRQQLLVEQKFVCAYCGQRVNEVVNGNGNPQMKTEHFLPQNGNPDNDLGYSNLLACCMGKGGEDDETKTGRKRIEVHCDSMKGNKNLTSITNPSLWQSRDNEIKYFVGINQKEVSILASEENKNKELTGASPGCLNLNHDILRKGRFSIYKNVIQRELGSSESEWNREQVQSLLDTYSDTSDGRHKPFKDFVLWKLNNWLDTNN